MPDAMPTSFPCPECRSPLRLRDRRFIGATFPCPACGASLTLLELSDDALTIRKASDLATSSPPTAAATRSTTSRRAPPSPVSPSVPARSALLEWLVSPLVISWVVAVVAGLGLVSLILLAPPPSVPTDLTDAPPTEASTDAVTPPATPPSTDWEAASADTPDDRFHKMGRRLQNYSEQHQHFPPGTASNGDLPQADRFGWLAALEWERPTPPAGGWPQQNRAWNDPVNERFVRRRVPEFLNPSVSTAVGENGYPTSHFVGVAGLGVDGPTLPVDHPRAGVFAWNRVTRREDIQDGESHVLAVMGAERRLGSWAEAGMATVRPLTAEPYIRGPDGFGTGSPDEMLVLMADGSVRTLSRQTAPRLVRRMATIADGLPLDPAIPGEPGDQPYHPERPSEPAPQAPAVAQNPPDAPPVSALTATAVTPVVMRPNAALALKQRLLTFHQETPAPRRELLSAIEDLLGRRIVWDDTELGPAVTRLDEELSVRLEGGTVEDLFRRILADTGLEFDIQAEVVRLRPARPSSPQP